VLDFGCGSGSFLDALELRDYTGVDQDQEALRLAMIRHPGRHFQDHLPVGELFDTVLALAVIEHFHEPATILTPLKGCLATSGRIVLTTPNRLANNIHGLGSRLGLFSWEAHQQHHTILDGQSMEEQARSCRLRVVIERRFLLGLNQLFVLEAIE
jgi:2-polyprenyl-3-methyl-5-hydroxy-6-metoxy-1,4-benzoquinol methylase